MKWFLWLLITCSLSSCANYTAMHYSVAQNVPLFTEKNELRLSAATGTETYGFQAAYAFSKSFAVMGSYSNGLDFSNGTAGDVEFSGTRMNGEFAVGYFKALKDSMIIEIFGGAGKYYGDFEAWSSAQAGTLPSDSVRANCTEPFIQFDLGLQHSRNHSFSLSCKFGYLIYDHFYANHVAPYGMPGSTKNNAIASPNIVPCITYRSDEKQFSFQAQAGLSTHSPASYYDTGGDFFVNVGLSLRLFGYHIPKSKPTDKF